MSADTLTVLRCDNEKRAAKLSTDEAKALRAKFDAGIVKVNAEVANATGIAWYSSRVRCCRPSRGSASTTSNCAPNGICSRCRPGPSQAAAC